ncbi:hypothetical protein POM88_037698 [Heracleum sosnowskyi]|uniref:KOW domain-containing protein n=1 Tax=Heracleum sosnowskyi TaxID=360622 RepID=A0AAD8HRM0_9APIA|nr:hypothetical protein POM88_037698 [Heracleum sosnowskyi]
MFKDGFLYKAVSIKSTTTQSIQPSFDELEKFWQPDENGDDVDDMASLSALFANRKKGHFMKSDRVIIVKGNLKNLKGLVEKLEEETVFMKPFDDGLQKTLAVIEKELCKCFEPGNHVKVVSGASEGATGMVVTVKRHLVNVVSDTTKEVIQVFSDLVVEMGLDNMSFGVIIRVENETFQTLAWYGQFVVRILLLNEVISFGKQIENVSRDRVKKIGECFISMVVKRQLENVGKASGIVPKKRPALANITNQRNGPLSNSTISSRLVGVVGIPAGGGLGFSGSGVLTFWPQLHGTELLCPVLLISCKAKANIQGCIVVRGNCWMLYQMGHWFKILVELGYRFGSGVAVSGIRISVQLVCSVAFRTILYSDHLGQRFEYDGAAVVLCLLASNLALCLVALMLVLIAVSVSKGLRTVFSFCSRCGIVSWFLLFGFSGKLDV